MSNNDVDSECSECEDEDNDEDNEDNDEEFAEESSSAGGFFKNKLRQWAIKFNVTLIALSALLLILQPIVNFHLPLDARTLLGTLRKVNISEMGDGEYYHFGLKRAVEAIIRENRRIGRKVDKLELTFNIDGLPIFNSTTKGLWLILCSEINSQGVYPVGAFFGKGKPNDANEFIRELVNELVDLTQKGLDGENVEISCSALICDVPAKSFMLYLKGHMGYYSCSKCCIKGEYVASKKKQPAKSKGKGKGKGSGTVCFPGIGPFKMKTDEGFLRNDYDEFDTGNETILKEIPKFGCVSGVPLDYMHLILLGVVKKLINMWLAGPLKTRLSPAHISKISKKLVILRRSIPSEFGRRPRSIWDFRHWKATEFRTFLLYCGPVVLKNILPIVLYENFILLHSAVTILLNKLLFNMPGNISCAHEMLERFVTDFADIYGKKFVSHNVHNLLHICSDAEKYGTLDQFSAFKFENYMTSIRKMIRKGDKPLQQIARRYAESEEAEKKKIMKQKLVGKKSHNSGPLTEDCQKVFQQYKILEHESFKINCIEDKNSYVMLKDGVFGKVMNIAESKDSIRLIVKKINSKGKLYDPPDSRSLNIHIGKVSNCKLFSTHVDNVLCKVWRIPTRTGLVMLPLLH